MLQTKAIGKTTGKKSAWGHLSLNSPDCENSRYLFASLEGAGLKCLYADRKLQIFFPRKASIEEETGVYILLYDFLGAVLFPSEEKRGDWGTIGIDCGLGE